MTDLWELENQIYSEGYNLICGVDEAGRGPLAGPVYAAAVILPQKINIPEVMQKFAEIIEKAKK